MKVLKYLTLILLYTQGFAALAQQSDSSYTMKKPSTNGTGKVYMGREIAQVMSFEGVEWLERNTRSQEENTNLAISKLPINKIVWLQILERDPDSIPLESPPR